MRRRDNAVFGDSPRDACDQGAPGGAVQGRQSNMSLAPSQPPDSGVNGSKKDSTSSQAAKMRRQLTQDSIAAAHNLLRTEETMQALTEDDLDHLTKTESMRFRKKERKADEDIARRYDMFFGCVIFVNLTMFGIETDMMIGTPNEFSMFWFLVESVFCVIYGLELYLRIRLEGRKFFKSVMNIFDCFLVFISVMSNWVWRIVMGDAGVGRMAVVLRMGRLIRLARIVRLISTFHELWLLCKGLSQAFVTLFWTAILMVIILYISAIFVTQMVGHNGSKWGSAPEHEWSVTDREIEEWFGSVAKSMFTMFQLASLDSWPYITRGVVDVMPATYPFFLLFLCVTSFMLMNLIIAIICEQTLLLSSTTKSEQQERDNVRAFSLLKQFSALLEGCDVNGDGSIGEGELALMLEGDSKFSARACDLLSMAEVSVGQVKKVFHLVKRDRAEVPTYEFIEALMMSKGLESNPVLQYTELNREISSIISRVERLESVAERLLLAKGVQPDGSQTPAGDDHGSPPGPSSPTRGSLGPPGGLGDKGSRAGAPETPSGRGVGLETVPPLPLNPKLFAPAPENQSNSRGESSTCDDSFVSKPSRPSPHSSEVEELRSSLAGLSWTRLSSARDRL